MNTNRRLIQELEKMAGQTLSLASLLASIREGESASQVEFAKLLGVSKQFLCDLEHQRRFISPKMAEDFALKLGYSPKQFVRLCLQDMIQKQGLRYEVDLQLQKVA
jgi:DNA-binding transcriptional regulator YiaG